MSFSGKTWPVGAETVRLAPRIVLLGAFANWTGVEAGAPRRSTDSRILMSESPARVVLRASSSNFPETCAQEYGSAAKAWAVLPNKLNERAKPSDGVSMVALMSVSGSVGSVTTPPCDRPKPAMRNEPFTGTWA